MEHRFKFRIWHKEMKQFFYPHETEYDESREYYPFKFPIGFKQDFKSDDFIFQQCTGNKDSKKNLVYEGDIVEMQGCKAEIGWEPAYAGFYINPLGDDYGEEWCDDWDMEDIGRMTVIGNNIENKF